MFGYIVSFVFGVYIAQEFNVPNVKKTTNEIITKFKKK